MYILGGGSQYVHTGRGSQYVHTGSGGVPVCTYWEGKDQQNFCRSTFPILQEAREVEKNSLMIFSGQLFYI